jgi:hypothetical protein
MAAGLWQAYPHLKNVELIDYIKRSASHYDAPDYLTGYGIPNFRRAEDLIKLKDNLSVYVYPNPLSGPIDLAIPKELIARALHISVYDLLGKLIYQEKITPSDLICRLKLDAEHLSTGMYIMNITGEGNYTVKLIKL